LKVSERSNPAISSKKSLMLAHTETSSPANDHIVAIAEARLGASSHRALRNVLCESEAGTLVLRGRLATFFQKQLAQEIVASIEGVELVVNHTEVVGWAT
jgi:osmotically-inducible protein OsmY